MNSPDDIHAAVKELRRHLGESQQAFAHRMGTAIRTIARWEKGRTPEARALMALAQVATKAMRRDLMMKFCQALLQKLGIPAEDIAQAAEAALALVEKKEPKP